MYNSEKFNFIKSIGGLKKGNTYVLIGGMSSGKSTAARSILFDLASKYKVFLFSTEENESLLRSTYNKNYPGNLTVFHEDEFLKETDDPIFLEDMAERLMMKFTESNSEIFFFDNITTSYFYRQNDGNPSLQGKFATKLIRIVEKSEFPMFIIGHTNPNIKNNAVISPSDIIGSKILAMKTPFMFSFQRIQHNSDNRKNPISVSLLRICKARGTKSTLRTFNLFHNSETDLFDQDAEVSIETFKDLIKDEVRW